MAAIKSDQEAIALLTPEQRDKEQSEIEKMMQHEHSGEMKEKMEGCSREGTKVNT